MSMAVLPSHHEDFDLPDRNSTAADSIPISLLTRVLDRAETTVLNRRKSIDVQSWLDAKSGTPMDYRRPNNIADHDRGKKTVRRDRSHQHAGIKRRARIGTFCHTLEHPITADDLCTWLELLMDFAGSDLLRLKAIVRVAGHPGPVLLHGLGRCLYPPVTLSQWPSGDRRTRIVLITRNLNEDCLRELLGILTAAASAHGRSQTPAIQPQLDRAAG
jgi:G3E family GTPase